MISIAAQLGATPTHAPSLLGQLSAAHMPRIQRRQNLPPPPSRHTMEACLAVLQDGEAHSTPAIADIVGKTPDTVRHSMRRLVEEGLAVKLRPAQVGKLRFSMWRKA